MVNLLQFQSTLSYTNQMKDDLGDNFRAFGDKYLFYVYFLDPFMTMFLVDPPYHILAWLWYLSCSHAIQHSTNWIHTTVPPQTAQIPSP